MKKEEYIKNPTGVSALSYWKTCHFKIPSSVKVLREDQFEEHFLEKYSDEVYFKMLHSLDTIGEVVYSDRFQFVKASTEDFAKHINSCYEKESISISELEIYKGRPVYDAELWICLYDTEKDAIVATGIAELDREIQEGYLDWIQVSKEYRGQGLGKVIVYELSVT